MLFLKFIYYIIANTQLNIGASIKMAQFTTVISMVRINLKTKNVFGPASMVGGGMVTFLSDILVFYHETERERQNEGERERERERGISSKVRYENATQNTCKWG